MKERYLDFINSPLAERRVRVDRRKAINSSVDPRVDRRKHNRRTNHIRKIKIQEIQAKKERRQLIFAGSMFIVSMWIAAYLVADWIVMY